MIIMEKNKNKITEQEASTGRRTFFRKTVLAGLGTAAGLSLLGACDDKAEDGETVKVLTTDGKLVEVEAKSIKKALKKPPAVGKHAREGIPGRKFVMVIDLAKCKNARKCISKCQEGHGLSAEQEWIKVHSLKDFDEGGAYWFPKPCYHCDNPPCVKVCPVDATYKRQDGVVLVDNERCIGCKFCISACPYSARIFNWKMREDYENKDQPYSPETGLPGDHGTIGKCDFCPDLSRNGILPYCVRGCPMGAIYFGDANEDAVGNGTEVVAFRQLLKDRAAYRYLEELGTKPRVFYLPPSDRMFDYERGLEFLSDEEKTQHHQG
jgi:molybdopterin-containing oxidoreductase family iron-sulfur binding subunit